MSRWVYLIFMLFLFANCKKADWSIPDSNCALPFADSSQYNAKHEAYKSVMEGTVSRGVPGMVVLVRTPHEGLWIGAAGQSKIETSEPMLPCHIHHSASVAKMYMGTSIMLLMEDGVIDLDATINTYLDKELCNRISNGNTATVRQLLNHTSGIRDFITETNHLTDYFNDYFNQYTTDDFLRYIYDKPAYFAPGEKAEYCNTNFVLITLIIDRVTGRPHGEFLSARIFNPQGLQQTFYKNEAGYPSPAGLVNSYWDRYGNGELENITEVAIHFDELSVGHDAMLGSAYDYAKFIEALLKGQVVSESSLAQMMDWTFDKKDKIDNGLALLRKKTPYGDAIGHGGGNFGVAMIVQYYPESDVTIVICTNISGFFPSPALDLLSGFIKNIEKIAFE